MSAFNPFAPPPGNALLVPSWLALPASELLQLEFSHASGDLLCAPTGTGKTAALLRLAAQLEPEHARPRDALLDTHCPADKDYS